MKRVKPTKVKYNLNKKTVLKNNKSVKNRFKKRFKSLPYRISKEFDDGMNPILFKMPHSYINNFAVSNFLILFKL